MRHPTGRALALAGVLTAAVGVAPAAALAAPAATSSTARGAAPTGAAATGAATLSPFTAHAAGAVLYANAAQSGAPSVAAAEVAQSGAGAAGGGAALTRADRFGVPLTTSTAQTSYGHGAGANVGLLQSQTVPGQVLLTQVDSTSPGSSSAADSTLLPVPLAPLASGQVVPGATTAAPLSTAGTCPAPGSTLSSGTSRAANAQVADLGAAGAVATIGSTSSSTSTTSLVPAPAGDGVQTQTVSSLAPLSLLGGLVQVQVLTPVALTTVAGGAPGTAKVSYGAVDANGVPVSPTTPVLTVTIDGQSETLTAQDLLGGGLQLGLGIADVTIFSPAHSLAGDETTAPTVAADGTSASAAADLVRVSVPGTLPAGTGIAGGPLGTLLTGVLGPLSSGLSTLTAPIGSAISSAGLTVADVRAGHLEAATTVPSGGVRCANALTPTGPTDPGNPLGESRKDVSATDVVAGQTFTYDVRVPNRGTDPITGVTVTDAPSGGLQFVSSTPAPTSQSGGTLTYALGTLQPNDVDVITLTFRVPAGTPVGTAFRNTATITGTYDGQPVTTTTTVDGPTSGALPPGTPNSCQIAATMFASNQQVAPNERFAYLVNVQDVGGAPCTSVTVTDPIPGGTTFAGCQGSCTHTGDTVTFDIGTLQPGQATTVGLTVLDTATSGTITNTATVTAAGADPVRLTSTLPVVTGTSVANGGSPVPGFGSGALGRAAGGAGGDLAFTGLGSVVPVVATALVAAGAVGLALRRRSTPQ